jgi:maltooligosyltrehalose trehalohydrolase
VSHTDADLVHAVREGRRREFAAFGWEAEVPDPQAEETFERSTLDRAVADGGAHAHLAALYRRLLRLRREEPALVPGAAGVVVASDDVAGWIRLDLTRDGARGLVALFNLAGEARAVPLGAGRWETVMATDDRAFGGRGAHGRIDFATAGSLAHLPPHAAELFAEQR